MTNPKEIEGVRKALDVLRWKASYFGGLESWNYIAAELSDKLPGNKYFAWDEREEKTVIVEKKVTQKRMINPLSNINELHDEVITRLVNIASKSPDADTLLDAFLLIKNRFGVDAMELTLFCGTCLKLLPFLEDEKKVTQKHTV